MDYKKIMLNLIEFNKLIQGWLDDMSCGELADEEKSIDWNDGAYNTLEKVKDALDDFDISYTDEDELDLFKLDYLNEFDD